MVIGHSTAADSEGVLAGRPYRWMSYIVSLDVMVAADSGGIGGGISFPRK